MAAADATPLGPGPQSTQSTDLIAMHDRLDSLWASYLRHLDAYDTAHKALQQHLRSGFFSLSRANFNARPGMRYGQDYFHEKATATTRVKNKQDVDGRRVVFIERKPSARECTTNETAGEKSTNMKPVQQPSPPATPDAADERTGTVAHEADADSNEPVNTPSDSEEGERKKTPLEADPLRWYGILVPRELRSAQTLFSSVFDGDIADATNASRALRELEIEIRKLRKEIRRAEKISKS